MKHWTIKTNCSRNNKTKSSKFVKFNIQDKDMNHFDHENRKDLFRKSHAAVSLDISHD
jgi:hypothetical protein